MAAPVLAETPDQAALRAVLEETGVNVRDHERHDVAIEDCTITTHWWKKQKDGTWLLWSSFQFNMAKAVLKEGEPGEFVVMALEGHHEQEDMALFMFEMRGDTRARYEVPYARRAPKSEVRPSPRGDGTSHYYRESRKFFIRHEGVGIAARAKRFGAAYVEYVARYCLNLG